MEDIKIIREEKKDDKRSMLKDIDFLSIMLINSMYLVVLITNTIPDYIKVVCSLALMMGNLVMNYRLIELVHSKDIKVFEMIIDLQGRKIHEFEKDVVELKMKDLNRK